MTLMSNMKKIKVDINIATSEGQCPSKTTIQQWALKTLTLLNSYSAVAIEIVDKSVIQDMNTHYRHKAKPTNVLSFRASHPIPTKPPFIGDIAICAAVVEEEALIQHKTVEAHFAHLVVHGILHLLGHDHETDDEAKKMESEEVRILQALGFSDPYLSEITHD